MSDKMKRFIAGCLLLAALALGTIPILSSYGVDASATSVAYADDGCDGPHPPPDLDCPNPTPTATPKPNPGQ